MNRELIRRLYDQSVMKATEANPGVSPCPAWAWEEAFAAAIVRECAAVVNDNDFCGSNLGDTLLLPHFGID